MASALLCAVNLRPVFLTGVSLFMAGMEKALGEDGGVTCYCAVHCPDNAANGTCEAKPGSHCFSAVEDAYNAETGRMEPQRTYGCLPPEERGFMQV
ncbi:hypothetical protein J437_LFUL019276, partial [Ladona fulva]